MNGPVISVVPLEVPALRDTVDAELIKWYREKSAPGTQFQGLSVVPHAKSIGKLIKVTGARTILDYGCGLGFQYSVAKLHKGWGVERPTLYDPGVSGLEAKPMGVFDGVICSDVLEHVPERLVDNVIAEIFSYAQKFVWLSICCRLAKKTFPDGRNLHVTVKSQEWWLARVADQVREGEGPCCRVVFTA